MEELKLETAEDIERLAHLAAEREARRNGWSDDVRDEFAWELEELFVNHPQYARQTLYQLQKEGPEDVEDQRRPEASSS